MGDALIVEIICLEGPAIPQAKVFLVFVELDLDDDSLRDEEYPSLGQCIVLFAETWHGIERRGKHGGRISSVSRAVLADKFAVGGKEGIRGFAGIVETTCANQCLAGRKLYQGT